ncbi:hypothetical protein HPG69_001902, partial [Diceros bicornis minor]
CQRPIVPLVGEYLCLIKPQISTEGLFSGGYSDNKCFIKPLGQPLRPVKEAASPDFQQHDRVCAATQKCSHSALSVGIELKFLHGGGVQPDKAHPAAVLNQEKHYSSYETATTASSKLSPGDALPLSMVETNKLVQRGKPQGGAGCSPLFNPMTLWQLEKLASADESAC